MSSLESEIGNSKIFFDVDTIDCLFDKMRCDLKHDTSAFCKTLKKDDRISIDCPKDGRERYF